VPNIYELDDFQVRTPTDVLGQHIHLVKFDVTSSDGSANGFNYEDGTVSPRGVERSRPSAPTTLPRDRLAFRRGRHVDTAVPAGSQAPVLRQRRWWATWRGVPVPPPSAGTRTRSSTARGTRATARCSPTTTSGLHPPARSGCTRPC
jgi:hypothetical protein